LPGKAGAPLVIGKVLVAGVGQWNAKPFVGAHHIPAHEIGRVVDPVTLCAALALVFLVFLPGPIECLAVAIGTALAAHRNDPKRELVRGAGIADELRFLVDRGHLDIDRHAPLAFGVLHRAEVARSFVDDAARIVEITGRRKIAAAATGGQQQQQDRRAKESAHLPLALYFAEILRQIRALGNASRFPERSEKREARCFPLRHYGADWHSLFPCGSDCRMDKADMRGLLTMLGAEPC
jgi:hypothetical protein